MDEINFRRKIYRRMEQWKLRSNGRTALLIDGARRVGKSHIVEEFAKNHYESYILIDFNEVPAEVKSLFDNYLDNLDDLLMYLSSYYGQNLYPRRSAIIFDEVQLCPRARSAIKYLVADGRYDYIETGSLVSIGENTEGILIPSEEEHLSMHPMDFEEFLWALGADQLVDFIRVKYRAKQPMGDAMHRKAMDYFRKYLIIGGMPQAVAEYISTGSFEAVDHIKRNILQLYRGDIKKHAGKYALKVENIFDQIPAQLGKPEKKFKLAALSENARSRDYENAFLWLDDAMIVNRCFNTTSPTVGLAMNAENTMMKCYLADTGLLISHAFDDRGIVTEEIYKKILFDALAFNSGMVIENIVAQMLVASGHKLFFYSNSSRENSEDRMEIDFLIAKDRITHRHNISPIEVKSGKHYTLTSIDKFCRKYHQEIATPIIIHTGDLKEEDGKLFLPLYMTGYC